MNYSQIRHYDIANGEGIRTTLFVSGCRFKCHNCFNEEYQNYGNGDIVDGKTFETIVSYVGEDRVDGLSILGGDPLWQDSEGLIKLTSLCHKVHQIEKSVWIWSGFTWEQIFSNKENGDYEQLRKELIEACDVFIDGQFKEELKDLRLLWRGSSNQRLINVRASLKHGEVVEWRE